MNFCLALEASYDFVFTHRFTSLILCLGQDENSLILWELFPCIVRIHLCGRSFPKRWASHFHIIERWLSNVGQFKGHQLPEILSVLLSVLAGVPFVYLMEGEQSDAKQASGKCVLSALREQARPR